MADRLEHLPHLAIAPFAHRDPQRRLPPWLTARRQQFDFGRLRPAPIDGDAASEALDVV
jgi:transposase